MNNVALTVGCAPFFVALVALAPAACGGHALGRADNGTGVIPGTGDSDSGSADAEPAASNDGGSADAQTAPAPGTTPCDGGQCVITLASFAGLVPVAIAVDATQIYWSAFPLSPCAGTGLACGGGPGPWPVVPPGSIQSITRAGGVPQTLVEATNNLGYGSIASDGANVYWALPYDGDASADTPYPPVASGLVMRTPATGGPPSVVASDQAYPTNVVADATGVYWENTGPGGDPQFPGEIMGLAAGTSTPVTIASNQGGLSGIAIDSDEVVWCANNDGTIMSAPRAGGAPSTLAAYFRCDEVAINVDGVYFVGGGDDYVTSRTGARPDAPTTTGPAGLLATDAHALYIATGASEGPIDEIVRVNTAAGADSTPAPIVLGQSYITSIAVDATAVYWTTFDGASGAVLMLAR